MKISVLSGLFSRFSLEKTFRMVSDIGFDGIEIAGLRPQAYPYDMDAQRCDSIRKLGDRYELEIPMYTPELLLYPYNISSPYRKEREETVDYLKKGIDAARGIGAPRMQLTCGHAGYFTDRNENLRNVTEVLKRLCEYADQREIDLIVEPLTIMESNTVVMLDTLAEIMQEIRCPRLKTMVDSVMVMTNWEPLDAYFEKLGDKIDYIHWGDSLGIAENHLAIGTGMMDAEGFFDIVQRHSYDGWVSLEMFGKFIREPEIHSARELRLLRGVLSGNDTV